MNFYPDAYNNLIHVGAGEAYTTVTAGIAAAAAGDCVVIHAGTYAEGGLGKNDVDWYMAPGAKIISPEASVIDQTNGATVLRMNIFGYGYLECTAVGEEKTALSISLADTLIHIECDTIKGSTGFELIDLNSSVDVRISIKCRHITQAQLVKLSGAATSHVRIECPFIYASSFGDINSGSLSINTENMQFTGVDPITLDGGRTIINGNINFLHNSTNGLVVNSGALLALPVGSITAPSGRPALAGTGRITVGDGYAYNVVTSTAASIISSNSRRIYELVSDDGVNVNWAGIQNPTSVVDLTNTTIKAVDDGIGAILAYAEAAATSSSSVDSKLTPARAVRLDFLDATTSSRLPATADEILTAIAERTGNLPDDPAAVGSPMTLATDAVNADSLATTAATEIAVAVASDSGLAASFTEILAAVNELKGDDFQTANHSMVELAKLLGIGVTPTPIVPDENVVNPRGIPVLEIRNISTTSVNITYSSMSGRGATGFPPSASGTLYVQSGQTVIIESQRVDAGQLDSYMSRNQIVVTRRVRPLT